MSYKGTTAASSVTNPPVKVSDAIAGGPSIWVYASSDASGTVDSAGYFSDGQALGMRKNDIVHGIQTSTGTPKGYLGVITAVSSTGATMGSVKST